MVFSSLTFLFCFLPLIIMAYYAINNRKYRNFILLIFSLGFYAWGEPIYVLLMILSLIVNYFSALFIDSTRNKNKLNLTKLFFALNIIFNIFMLLVFKYADFLIGNFNFLFRTNLPLIHIALPIGISFYTFQIFSYVIDVYKKDVKVQKSFVILSAYITLFPQLIAGPIVRYQTVEKELIERKENFENFSNGIRRFIIGLGKKVIISNQVGLIADTIFSYNNGTLGFSGAWVGIIAYTLQIYFDFSGYSDMAIGLGKMFGFHFLENFNYPYIANTITDFWRRWHISLSSWFKDYVYIPLGGNRVSKLRWLLNIFIVWFLTGMWHGASWNFILWGLYFGFILILEKIFFKRNKKKNILNNLFTFLLVLIGFVLFRIDSLSLALKNIKSLFIYDFIGIKFSLSIIAEKIYLLLYFIPAVIFSFKLDLNKKINVYLYDFLLIVVFALSILFLITQNFNPFIYFRF